MTAFMRDSFSVGSPGTEDYADKHTRIFSCPLNKDLLKSKCEHCKQLAVAADVKKEEGGADVKVG